MKHIFILAATFVALSGTTALAHPHGKTKAEPAKKTWPYFGDAEDEIVIEDDHEHSEDHSEDNSESHILDDKDSKDVEIKKTEKPKVIETPKSLQNIEKHFKKHADHVVEGIERATANTSFPEFKGDTIAENADDIRAAAKALENMLAESDVLENMADMVISLAENIEVDTDDDGLTLRFDGETLGSLNIKREGRMNEAISIEGLGKNMNVEKDVIIKNGKKRTRIIIEMDTDDDVEIDIQPKE